jgi:uncharacterized protein YacL
MKKFFNKLKWKILGLIIKSPVLTKILVFLYVVISMFIEIPLILFYMFLVLKIFFNNKDYFTDFSKKTLTSFAEEVLKEYRAKVKKIQNHLIIIFWIIVLFFIFK